MPEAIEKAGKIEYEFSSKFSKYKEDDACEWNFLFLPKELASEIRENHKWQEEGWGRLKATVKIGGSEWRTSIWFDTKNGTYLLPLKAEIRRKEKIEADQEVKTTVWI